MPEFAEVNIQIQYLRERCLGWQIESFGHKGRVHFKDLRELPEEEREQLLAGFYQGNVIEDVTQRGKQVIFRMQHGIMLTHLMFRGRWTVAGDPFLSNYKHHRELPTEKSNTLWLEITDGERLNFHDTDYKGHVTVFPDINDPAEVPGLAKLGPEALLLPETDAAFRSKIWDLPTFQQQAARSRQAIKVFLLDQKKQSGLGNMYVCESLYRAKIAPERSAKSLSKAETEALFDAAQAILRLAIETALDYQQVLLIYNREVDPDGFPVEVIKVGGRDTHWVPQVQS